MVRPFRAWGYPVTTVLVLVGSLLFLVAAVDDDPRSAAWAAALLAAAVPLYTWMRWKQKSREELPLV